MSLIRARRRVSASRRTGPGYASGTAAHRAGAGRRVSPAASPTSACCGCSSSNSIPVHCITGVSAGSIVAAAYASGATPDEIGARRPLHALRRRGPLELLPHGFRGQRTHGALPRQAAEALPLRGDAAPAGRGGHGPRHRRTGALPGRGRRGAAHPRQLLLPGPVPAGALGWPPAGGRRHEHGGAGARWRATWGPRASFRCTCPCSARRTCRATCSRW